MAAAVQPPATETVRRTFLAAYHDLAEQIRDGDVAAAFHKIEAIDALAAENVEDRPPLTGPPNRPRPIPGRPPTGGPVKLAERVALAMRDDIERAGWPVGEVFGSEAELIARYDISRSIFRESVRILEHDGAVRMKRGPSGGLIVTAPDQTAIVHAAAMALEYARVTTAQLVEVRTGLEAAATRIADADNCRPLVLFVQVLTELVDRHAALRP